MVVDALVPFGTPAVILFVALLVTAAARIIAAEAPSGVICMGCAAIVASELPDPPQGEPL